MDDSIEFRPPLNYRSALEEILSADALLVCQGAICNGQIPAKIYEYMYSQKTIIGICDPGGDTGTLLKRINCPYVAALEDADAIQECLHQFVSDISEQNYWVPDSNMIKQFSRRESSKALADVLSKLLST